MDNKERFTNRVDAYVKYRPSYPREAVDYLYASVGLRVESRIADIGAGTGIFSELLLERGSRVIAIEPNPAMREAAIQRLGSAPNYEAVSGSAEATGLPNQSVHFIVCAQAFHWFDLPAAQAEFRRILQPGGCVALIWNSRLSSGTPFRDTYEQLLRRYATDYNQVNHKNISPMTLRSFFKNGTMRETKFGLAQSFDFHGLQGRLSSSSYCPEPEHPNYVPMMTELRQLFDEHQQEGRVFVDYETEIYWGEL